MSEYAQEWGLSAQEAARVSSLVAPDEELLLVAKPRVAPPVVSTVVQMLPGLLVTAGACSAVWWAGTEWWPLALFLGPVWAIAVASLSAPLWYRWRMERTLYLLTNRRVVVVEPRWSGVRVLDLPLYPNPVREVVRGKDGCGDIVFTWARRWHPAYLREVTCPVGFIAVPQVERVARLIAAQVEGAAVSRPVPLVGRVAPPNRVVNAVVGVLFAGVAVCVAALGGWGCVRQWAAQGLSIELLAPLLFLVVGGAMCLIIFVAFFDSNNKKNQKTDER